MNYVAQMESKTNKFNIIDSNLCCSILYFLPRHFIYSNALFVCRFFNECVKKYVSNTLFIRPSNKEYIMKNTDKIKTHNINFHWDNISKEDWVLIKKMDIRRSLTLHSCKISNEVTISKNIKEISFIECKNIDIDGIVDTLKMSTIEKLFVRFEFTYHHPSELDEFGRCRLKIKNDLIKKISCLHSLQELGINYFDFEETLIDISYLNKLNLTKLNFNDSNFEDAQITNIVMPSLTCLSLVNTKITNEFVKNLNILNKQKVVNITELDISGTNITSKCFNDLSKINLTKLCIDYCSLIENFNDLYIPSLTYLSLSGAIFGYVKLCDDKIMNIFKMPLNTLYIDQHIDITDITLTRICDSKLKISTIGLRSTGVTRVGIAQFNEKMKNVGPCNIEWSDDEEEDTD